LRKEEQGKTKDERGKMKKERGKKSFDGYWTIVILD